MRASLARATLSGHRNWQRVRDKTWSLLIAGGFASFGSHSVLALPIRLSGVEGITIGDQVYIGPGSWLQTLPQGGLPPRLTIGDGTRISGTVVISAACEVTLGRNVLVAKNVYVSDHIHAYDDADAPIVEQGLARIEPVRIGDGSWLGQGVVVVPGVTIGSGSVIGANSVVTGDVPDRALAVGAPATVVKRFDDG